MMKFLVSFVLVAALAVSGCGGGDGGGGSPTAPSANVPFSALDLQLGTGTEATNGRLVTVNYSGWVWSATGIENKGEAFDSSLAPGRMPYSFVLGTGNVIQGWHRGILSMRAGGRRRLIIPPELAYGNNPPPNQNTIRANETLIFDVELLSVQ